MNSSYCSDHIVQQQQKLLQQEQEQEQEQEQLPPDDDRITITTSRFYVQLQYNSRQLYDYEDLSLIGIHDKKMKKSSRVFSHEYYSENSSVQISLAMILTNEKFAEKIPLLCRHRFTPSLKYSYQGFLVLTGDTNDHKLFTMFYNPVTEQQLIVEAPQWYIFCGIYFHSPTQEYRLLYQVLGLSSRGSSNSGSSSSVGYAVLGLRTRSLRMISSFSHTPYRRAHDFPPNRPVILNGAIHWMCTTNDNSDLTILLFMIESEEFHVMPHPKPDCDHGHARIVVPLSSKHGNPHTRHYHKQSLMEMEGKLCFCNHCCNDTGFSYCVRHKIDIWVLEDYEQRIWVKRHVVKHETLAPLWKLPDASDRHINALFINNINNNNIVGGSSTDHHDDAELVLESITEHKQYCIFYLHHLKKGTLRRLEVPLTEERRPTDQVEYVENIVDFHLSLISLHSTAATEENYRYFIISLGNPSKMQGEP